MTEVGQLLRELRSERGISLRDLAEASGTSSATLSNYETGGHEPKLSTAERIANTIGFELVLTARPRLTQDEVFSLNYHRRVAELLLEDPSALIQEANRQLHQMRSVHVDGRSDQYFDAWDRLLHGPRVELYRALTATDQRSIALRHVTPFAGVMPADERLSLLRDSRK